MSEDFCSRLAEELDIECCWICHRADLVIYRERIELWDGRTGAVCCAIARALRQRELLA